MRNKKSLVNLLYFLSSVSKCPIESSDKASKRCRRLRQNELTITRKDYQLAQDHNQLARLNKNPAEVYGILQRDALDHHWITLYNYTIYKNLGLFLMFNATKEDDYIKIYNFFVQNQLTGVPQVSSLFFLSLSSFSFKVKIYLFSSLYTFFSEERLASI